MFPNCRGYQIADFGIKVIEKLVANSVWQPSGAGVLGVPLGKVLAVLSIY